MNLLLRLVAEGDSITASVAHPSHVWQLGNLTAADIAGGNAFASYSPQFFNFRAGDMLCLNRAVAGSRLRTNGPNGNYPGDLTFRAGTWVDALVGNPQLTPDAKVLYIFSVMIGTNPDTTDPEKAAADLQTYLQARVAAGFSGIMVGTILPRGDGILADFETYRQGYNGILRTAEWQSGIGTDAFALADFGNEPTVGAPNACFDSSLFSDKVHLTDLGYTYLAPIYAAAVDEVKSTLIVSESPAPVLVLSRTADGNKAIFFKGTLETSSDMTDWQVVSPQPVSPFRIPADSDSAFYRVSTPVLPL